MPTRLFLETLGVIAGIITTSSFVPQIVKGYKTKSLEDVSSFMFFILGSGMSLWLIYGFFLKSVAVIAANIAGISFCIAILIMKRIYSKNDKKRRNN